MGYVLAVVVGIIIGAVATWIYKAKATAAAQKAAAAAQKELNELKSAAVQGINKL